jgi:hypothetical protein
MTVIDTVVILLTGVMLTATIAFSIFGIAYILDHMER